jgi:hypothetical protein
VFLDVIQDPAGAAPPTGTGGASTRITATLTSPTTWEATLNLLNGPYRLQASSNVDLPASIDVTVAAPGNPATLQCVTDPGGGGVQARAFDWTPLGVGGPTVNFNFSRSANPAAGVELAATPTNYPAGTDFVCTQNTNGRIPRVVIIGAEPKLSTLDSFAGWSFDSATSTLTIRMETVSLTLPSGTPITSAIAGVFVHYDDSPLFPGTLPALTGTYLAANASFTFTPVFQSGGITALSTTLDGPTGSLVRIRRPSWSSTRTRFRRPCPPARRPANGRSPHQSARPLVRRISSSSRRSPALRRRAVWPGRR